jgi:deoxyuridine 5'-triphosphate nucleotidohydrolase
MASPCASCSRTRRALRSSSSASPLVLRVQKLSAHAVPPARASAGAAGYDLCAAYDGVVPARGRALLKTDIALAVPAGTYGRVAPRSGLALKAGIDTGAGVIDEDYRGNVGVILFNHSDVDFTFAVGDRVAQLVLERIAVADVEEVATLDDTARGAGGFGSTGVAAAPPAAAAGAGEAAAAEAKRARTEA